ncbi:MAG: autoinducer binding domain-containing protein [Candidatus Thiocaldithrix dubininis]|uniref:Autoinducer binding domain-containing protein n=1 Tax=Candidatus Thiocaldithrix dubininis TaxID=3080823 RepID=A0AA95KJ82_9GAMM|nr:MAG: autoinducer binding domain-containing protein [Candidatus Thiocaldithrix dubininis]
MKKVDHFLLGRYIAELYAASTLETRFKVFEKYVKELGFEGASYTFAPRAHWEVFTQMPAIFLHSDTYPQNFLTHYAENRLDRHDFTIRKVLQGEFDPMDWREHELQRTITLAEAKVIELAREDYGIVNAITIPTMMHEMGAAGASVISSEKDSTFGLLKQQKLDTLIHLTRLFHDLNFANFNLPDKFILPLFETLKPKEIVILQYLATGKPMKNIQDYTGISHSYATNVLAELRLRLGGINNDKLMYLFGLMKALMLFKNSKFPWSM